jgi:hypothetical protein
MIKFINILENVISEQKKYQFHPEVLQKLKDITNRLWNDRKKKYKGRTLVDSLIFHVADGTEGLVKFYVNPDLPYIGFMDTEPKKSTNPKDIYIDVNPKNYESKKNLYLTLYHEMIHASDPNLSTKMTKKYMSTYDENSDEKYWGHPIEFFAITNEFLEGLINEFQLRVFRLRNVENKKALIKSFNNILNYFSKGEKLSRLSLNILDRINDTGVVEDKFKRVFSDISVESPISSELVKSEDEEPYYLTYINLIKKYNPKIWTRFLTMLYKAKEDVEDVINKKGLK